MTLSLSSSVRPLVRLFLCSLVHPSIMKEFFFSLKSYNGVQGSLKGVAMKYEGSFLQVSWRESCKGVSRKFRESFKGVLREFQRSSQDNSWKF